jgi:hypothetical protein
MWFADCFFGLVFMTVLEISGFTREDVLKLSWVARIARALTGSLRLHSQLEDAVLA